MADLFATGTAGILASWELNRLAAALQGTFGWTVQSGAVTFSSGLIFNVAAVAAGDCTVNSVTNSSYAGGTVTLSTQDPTNPRVDVVVITSAGAVSVIAGTPAALTSAAGPVPTAPSASQLEIARIFVPASGTPLSASSITDKRATLGTSLSAVALAGSSSAATSTTSVSAVDLVTISGLSITVGTPFRVEFNFRKLATSANAVGFGLKLNSTVVVEANVAQGGNPESSATQQAENGMAVFSVNARSSANYLTGLQCSFADYVSASGALAFPTSYATSGASLTLSAALPNATITAIAIRAINGTSSNTVEITSVRILTGID